MSNENEDSAEAPLDAPKPQKINLVKPLKRLNEMTEEERRAWAMALGEAFKKKQAQPNQDDMD